MNVGAVSRRGSRSLRAAAKRWRRSIAGVLLGLAVGACAPDTTPSAPPLRPLLYTEPPRGTEVAVPGYEEWTDPDYDPTAWPTEFATSIAGEAPAIHAPAMTPEALLLDVFAALVEGDQRRLLRHTFDPEHLARAGRMNADTAERVAEEIREETLGTLAVFQDGGASVAARSLQPGQIVVGRGRRLDGAVAGEEDRVIMHWGSELTFTVEGTGLEFELRYPNLLLGEDGVWRLRDAPSVGRRFRAFRAMGLHLMPELMDVEHAPLPLAVGNYWHYRTRQPGVGEEVGTLTRGGYRDSVVELEEYDGYRVARIRRVYDDPAMANERHTWLITPRRLYVCDRECSYRASDVGWILGYGERTTPQLMFPLQRGAGWSAGGADERDNTLRVTPDPSAVSVPAGAFPDAYELVRSTSRGRQSSFFVPGIGFVLYRTQTAVETNLVELVDFRILP